jgi:hypothetical protein
MFERVAPGWRKRIESNHAFEMWENNLAASSALDSCTDRDQENSVVRCTGGLGELGMWRRRLFID